MKITLLALAIFFAQSCSSFQINPLRDALQRTKITTACTKHTFQTSKHDASPTRTRTPTALFMGRNANPKVIYQKVIRAPKDNQFFLPSLIDYMQTDFQVPKDLPMVYTLAIPSDDGNDDDDQQQQQKDGDGYSILEMDSPLSRNSDATRMEVEVVGIYTDEDNASGATLPSMAMVVVKKMNILEGGDVIMKRMFDDSEAKIVKALDVGLDDFVDGKVVVRRGAGAGTGGWKNSALDGLDTDTGSIPGIEMDEVGEWSALDSLGDFEGFDEIDGTMEDLMVASTGKNTGSEEDISKSYKDDGIIDAVVSDVTENEKDGVGARVRVDKRAKATNEAAKPQVLTKATTATADSEPVQDFAVQAAKAVAARRKRENENKQKDEVNVVASGGDFAVESAKAAAAAKKMASKESTKTKVAKKKDKNNVKKTAAPAMPQEVTMGEAMPMELPTVGVSPMLQNLSKGVSSSSSFQVKISDKESFVKQNKVFEKAITANANGNNGASANKKGKQIQRNINMVTDTSVDTTSLSEEERQKSFDDLSFKEVTASIVDPPSSSFPTIENGEITKTDKEMEQDILKAAMDMMPGQSNEGPSEDDMSAEELLKSILKFGDEKEKEEADGSGFVKGAFSKAKELTAEKKTAGVSYKEVSKTPSFAEDIKYEDAANGTKTLSPEEELKLIFAAGEKIAEGRMTPAKAMQDRDLASPEKKSQSIVTDQYVDELIEKDKTVPGNARTLDDELAELEVRISKSPGEDTEAYGPNAVFDVFSGPEVYNPNVDPLSAVNWPGALPETRTDVRLPPELDEAVKSAKFAANLLSRIIEEEQDDDKKVFYIDGKRISDNQVQRLRQAVDDGVAVGLIDDPIKFMKERSRLQMLVNELSNQPEERFGEIATFYKDLLLSDNFVTLLKENLSSMASKHLEIKRSGEDPTEAEAQFTRERHVLGKLVKYSQLLLKEVQALGAELETTQLEVIRSICNVAMNPDHTTEEETAEALSDAVRDMKPLLDESFVAYLKYAIAEEEGRLARGGLLDDPEYNRWLFVLQIVQEGVYAELGVGVQRYIDHISYVLRMETKKERKQLLAELIDVMPSLVSSCILLSVMTSPFLSAANFVSIL